MSLSGCKGAECSDKSLGPGLGDLPLRSAPSGGPPPLKISVIINRDLVAAVCGMTLVSSCTVMPDTANCGFTRSVKLNTLAACTREFSLEPRLVTSYL